MSFDDLFEHLDNIIPDEVLNDSVPRLLPEFKSLTRFRDVQNQSFSDLLGGSEQDQLEDCDEDEYYDEH